MFTSLVEIRSVTSEIRRR